MQELSFGYPLAEDDAMRWVREHPDAWKTWDYESRGRVAGARLDGLKSLSKEEVIQLAKTDPRHRETYYEALTAEAERQMDLDAETTGLVISYAPTSGQGRG